MVPSLTTRLVTKQLVLRPPRTGDVAEIRRLLRANHEHLKPWNPAPPPGEDPSSITEVSNSVLRQRRDWKRGRGYVFMLAEREQPGTFIGKIALSGIMRGAMYGAYLGYWMAADVQGRGLATEGIRAVLDFALRTGGSPSRAGGDHAAQSAEPARHREARVPPRGLRGAIPADCRQVGGPHRLRPDARGARPGRRDLHVANARNFLRARPKGRGMRSSSLEVLVRVATVGVALVGELVAPTRCVACEERVGPRVLFCTACGASVLPAAELPPRHHAVFEYGGAVATAIVRFKYAGRSDLAARFSGIMAAAAALVAPEVDLVVPVPLHPRRLVERGFDQAALLGGPIARRLGIAHEPRALLRTRATPPQASLDQTARAANVANAFAARQSAWSWGVASCSSTTCAPPAPP